MLKAIHTQEDYQATMKKAEDVVEKLQGMKLTKAAKQFEETIHETRPYRNSLGEHWRSIATNHSLGRLMREKVMKRWM